MTAEIIEEVDAIETVDEIDHVDAIEEVDDDWLSVPPPTESPAPQFEEPAPPPDPSTFHFVDPDDKVVPPRARSDSGRWLDAHLLTILATVAAVPALRIPAAWVIACSIAALVMLAIGSVKGQVKDKGSADVVVVPARVVGRMLLGAINPLNWLKVLLGALAALTVGALAAAMVAGAQWLVAHGTDGILAAMRMGAWAHALTYGAFAACVLLLRGGGRTADRRANALHRVSRRIPEAAVAGLTACVVIAFASIAVAGPDVDVGMLREHDGLGWVPAGLRGDVDGLRDEIVTNELDAATECLSGDQVKLWTATYTAANPVDDPDVARLTADPARAPDQSAVAAAALVAHNHLGSWVEVIEVAVGDEVVLTIDRRGLPRDEPLTDAAVLRGHAAGTPDWLTAVAPTVNAETVLSCSAGTPL
jgi:hypothetical protein